MAKPVVDPQGVGSAAMCILYILFLQYIIYCNILGGPGVSGNDFWTLGTRTRIAQPIPKFWERERKIAFPTFGNGNGNDKFHSQFLGTGTGMTNSIPNFRERE